MKGMKYRYGLLLVGMLAVSSLSSCAAIKRAKAKRCQCPTWGYEQVEADDARTDHRLEAVQP